MTSSQNRLIDSMFCYVCGCPLILSEKIRNIDLDSSSPTNTPLFSKSPTDSPSKSPRSGAQITTNPQPLSKSSTVSFIKCESAKIQTSESQANDTVELSHSHSHRKNINRKSFNPLSRSKNKTARLATMLIQTPTQQFYQWFNAMNELYDNFGIPCSNCINTILSEYQEQYKSLDSNINIYQFTSCQIFQECVSLEDTIESLQQEVNELTEDISCYTKIHEELTINKDIVDTCKIVTKDIEFEHFECEHQLIETTSKVQFFLSHEAFCRNKINEMPIQKVLTWDQLFPKSKIVPEEATFPKSFVALVKSKPLTSILALLFKQMTLLADRLNYQYQCVRIPTSPSGQFKGNNLPVISTKELANANKKQNKAYLQILLQMLVEFANLLSSESCGSFFLVYVIENTTINGLDFLNYDNKKWPQALDCFLSNTSNCYRWILKHYK
ncbi:Atg6 BARA domain-containing protein [Entamoeba marina]